MTAADWFGLILTVLVFIVMLVAYIWVLNPKNKESIESHRTMLLDEDDIEAEK